MMEIAMFLMCYVLTALHDHHMFQLNSYKAGTYARGLFRNFHKDYARRHYAVILLVFAAFLRNPYVLSFLYAIQAYQNRPRKAKKPLAYTPRMVRMLVTHSVIVGSITVWSCLINNQSILLASFFAATPLFTALSNLLNSPLEKAINNWYISDAKRILREMPRLIVIGITGSYGKTSTKFFLQKLLSYKYNTLMTPESFNTPMGVVKTVRTQLRPVHDVFVCEMGAKNTGDIKELCDIARPRHGVITAVGPQHLETFKTIENVEKTKFELADAVMDAPSGGMVFLNYDYEIIRNRARGNLVKDHKKVTSYSASGQESDYAAKDISVSSAGSSFCVTFPDGEERRFETKLIGKHNVQNIAAAIAVADYLGVDRDDVVLGVRRLETVPHRLQLIRKNSIIIIDDAYNSNPGGASAALETLGMFEGVKIMVTPGMVEMGEAQDEANRRFGAEAAGVCDFVFLMGKHQTGSILKGLRDASFPEEKVKVAETLEQAFEAIEKIDAGAKKQKIVLLENDLPDNY
ncbi:MAG: UDP-N-acetylmuramoyl-tripeptide--D-alanyl-D-alanine ligase [Synergistaceae bacterium]|nr:UDP-N-acetylmuramoyl-tripeptide--D-alanyl-D-alanine ligase [Synergistaceae bacterium]